MTKVLAIAAIALSLTTGFTCSKSTPEAAPEAQQMETAAPAQEAAPEATEEAPAEGAATETAPTE